MRISVTNYGTRPEQAEAVAHEILEAWQVIEARVCGGQAA
jgi:hypothetical protein